jgi:Ni/Co efflux regulator RcnB
MKRQRQTNRVWIADLCGAALMVGTPLLAQADQGKWWTPKERETPRERRVEQKHRIDRRNDHDGRRMTREVRPRFQRDVVFLRHGERGPRFRAHRVFVRPLYLERQQICVIRPVRYFSGISANLGSVRIHARLGDHNDWYGCNFCDARFDDYRGYHRHVVRCDDRPDGYHFDVRDWDDDWYDES